jgi:hypothetical protein
MKGLLLRAPSRFRPSDDQRCGRSDVGWQVRTYRLRLATKRGLRLATKRGLNAKSGRLQVCLARDGTHTSRRSSSRKDPQHQHETSMETSMRDTPLLRLLRLRRLLPLGPSTQLFRGSRTTATTAGTEKPHVRSSVTLSLEPTLAASPAGATEAMCCDSLSDGALLLHEIMPVDARPMELPMTPPSLCSGFDKCATCCQPWQSRPVTTWAGPNLPLYCTNLARRLRQWEGLYHTKRRGIIAQGALTPIEPRRTYLLGRFAAGPAVHSESHSRATSSAFTPVLLKPCCAHSALSCATVCALSSALFTSRADKLADVGAPVAGAGRLHRKHCPSALSKIAPSASVSPQPAQLIAADRCARTRISAKPLRRATQEQRVAHGRRPTHARAHPSAHNH